MARSLHTVEEVSARIDAGETLLIAGDEALLAQLPQGRWIGGTIPYFMSKDGGRTSRDLLHVDVLPEEVTDVAVRTYSANDLCGITQDAFDDGFSVIIVPGGSIVHTAFAVEAPDLPGIRTRPLVGWVAGVHLDDLGVARPRTFAGSGDRGSPALAAVLHARLAPGVRATARTVALFSPGDGATLTFDSTGFTQDMVLVDGEPWDFTEYLAEIGHDTRLPLVSTGGGERVNVSFQTVPDDGGTVHLYAPVFSGVEYRLAAPLPDLVAALHERLPAGSTQPAFSFTCVLNYVYSELEGKRTGDFVGPATFGEIAHQLHNQTLVYLSLHE